MDTLSARLKGEEALFLEPASENEMPPFMEVRMNDFTILVNHMLFADDTTLLANSYEEAQKLLDVCSEWSKAVGLDFAPSKSYLVEMGFENAFEDVNEKEKVLKLNGIVIQRVEKFKFLGMFVAENGDHQVIQDREGAEKKLKEMMGSVSFLFNARRGIPLRTSASILRTFAEGLFYYNVEVHPLDLEQTRKMVGQAARTALQIGFQASITEALRFLGWPEPRVVSIKRQFSLLKRMLESGEEIHRKLMEFVLTIDDYDENDDELCYFGSWKKRLVLDFEKFLNEKEFGWNESKEDLIRLGLEGGVRKVSFWKKLISIDNKEREDWIENVFEKARREPHSSYFECPTTSWRLFRIFSFSLVPWERETLISEKNPRIECELCGEHFANGIDLIRKCKDEKVKEAVVEDAKKFLVNFEGNLSEEYELLKLAKREKELIELEEERGFVIGRERKEIERWRNLVGLLGEWIKKRYGRLSGKVKDEKMLEMMKKNYEIFGNLSVKIYRIYYSKGRWGGRNGEE